MPLSSLAAAAHRPLALSLLLAVAARALDNGMARTPPLGFNSWTAFGSGVTEADLRATADFFVSSGLAAAGYAYVNSDDGFSLFARDNVTGRIVADPVKFPSGIAALSAYIHGKGLKFGIYSASSSVVCSGRPGSLYSEALDAETFVLEWAVDYIKLDLCGEYAFGNQARLAAFVDALNATGRAVVLSTEPYDIVPDPSAAAFSNVWRCCSDIYASWDVIVDRLDRNDVLAPLVGPGHWSDPDMLQVGNGALTAAEQRAHFALWAMTKSPLLLATDITRLSAAQLTLVTNAGLIAVNQDALGVPARKLTINGGAPPLRHVGLAPCEAAANAAPTANLLGGDALRWELHALAPVNGTPAFALFNRAAARCLAVAAYAGRERPVLLPCSAADATQAWALPVGVGRLGALLSLGAGGAAGPASALAPLNSTLYASAHGSDVTSVSDAAYGLTNLGLVPWSPEPPCHERECQGYDPHQTWHFSARTGLVALALYSANHYHCYDSACEFTTSVVPAPAALCLAHVLSVAYEGTDPLTWSTSQADVWGGPLAGGEFSLALHNRAAVAANVSTTWTVLGLDAATALCVQDLFAGGAVAGPVAGGVTRELDAHDVAALRVWPPSDGGKCASRALGAGPSP